MIALPDKETDMNLINRKTKLIVVERSRKVWGVSPFAPTYWSPGGML